MPMDIRTLAVVLGLANLVQAVVLVLLYRSHSSRPGLGCWAAGACAFATGFVCNYLRDMTVLGPAMIIANNVFFISGFVLLYRGIVRFFGQQERLRLVGAACLLIMLVIVYYTFVIPDLSARRVTMSLTIAGFSLLIAAALRASRSLYRAMDLLLVAFLANGLFFIFRAGQSISVVPNSTMFEASTLQVATYVVPLITTMLWTLGFVMLVSQRAQSESAEAREHFELIFNASPNAVLITSLHTGRFVSINDAFTRLTGYSREELQGRTTLESNIWHDSQVRSHIVEQLVTTGQCDSVELSFRHKDGHLIDGLFSSTIIKLQGEPHILSVTQDISERKKLEAELQQREAHYRMLTEDVSDVVWKMDNSFHFTYISPADERLRGFRNDEVVGHHVFELMTDKGIEAIKHGSMRRKEAEERGEEIDQLVFEVQQRCKDGSLVWTEIISIAERDANGIISGYHGVTRNINERKLAEMALAELNCRLEAMSSTDGLTGIANRRHFDEELVREYARHVRSGAELGLIMLDIDHFKAFNDTYGHVAGDECLQEIANIMVGCANRAADLVARYGGEEFVCILPETDLVGAVAIAEKIRQAIIARAIPHKASGVAAHITASLGVASMYCTADSSGRELLKQADDLLYLAKAHGRNQLESMLSTSEGRAGLLRHQKELFVQLAWRSAFCCGNQLIDTQHKTLFTAANLLMNAVLGGCSKEQIRPVIGNLLEETVRHFRDEEQYLDTIDFPGLTSHAAEHALLLEKGRQLVKMFEEDQLAIGDLFSFLTYEVVMQHMLDADRAFFPYVQEARQQLDADY